MKCFKDETNDDHERLTPMNHPRPTPPMRLCVRHMNLSTVENPPYYPPHTPNDAIHYDAPIAPEQPLQLGLVVRLHSLSVVGRRRGIPGVVKQDRVFAPVDLRIEGALERVLAATDDAVSLLLTNSMGENPAKHVVIRVPNLPGKTIEIAERDMKDAARRHVSVARLTLDDTAKIVDMEVDFGDRDGTAREARKGGEPAPIWGRPVARTMYAQRYSTAPHGESNRTTRRPTPWTETQNLLLTPGKAGGRKSTGQASLPPLWQVVQRLGATRTAPLELELDNVTLPPLRLVAGHSDQGALDEQDPNPPPREHDYAARPGTQQRRWTRRDTSESGRRTGYGTRGNGI